MTNCAFATRVVEAISAPVAARSTSGVSGTSGVSVSSSVLPFSTRGSLSVPTTTTSWRDSLVAAMQGTGLGTAGAHHNSIAKPKAAIVPAADNAPAKAGVAYGAAKQAAPPRGIPR